MQRKTARMGRPKTATAKVAYQIRLEQDEGVALEALVERRKLEAAKVGATASAAAVLRAIVRSALLAEGLLPADPPKAPRKAKR
jgi:hypothetical protein